MDYILLHFNPQPNGPLSIPTASPVCPRLTWPKFLLITGQVSPARLFPPAFVFWFHGTDLCWKHCEVFPESPGSYFQQSPNTCFGFTKPGWQTLHQFEPSSSAVTQRKAGSRYVRQLRSVVVCLFAQKASQLIRQSLGSNSMHEDEDGWKRKWSELIPLCV